MKKFLALTALASLLALAALPAADNFTLYNTRVTGGTNPVVIKAADNGDGTWTIATTRTSTATVAQQTLTWTQSVVTLTPATSTTIIAANTSRKALRWMVTGTNPMTVAPGAVTVTVGAGMNYNGASASGYQGGSDAFPGEVSQQTFSGISAAGTTVVIWEGQ